MRPAFACFVLLATLAVGCAGPRAVAAAPTETPAAPAEAPKKFSMRTYYLVLLRRGPAWTAERTPEALAAGEGHMANIRRLAACGKLLIAGPFKVEPPAPSDALAGLFLFDVATKEEALALTQTDPAVQAGRFTVEVLTWYGPVGLTYDGQEKPVPGARCEP